MQLMMYGTDSICKRLITARIVSNRGQTLTGKNTLLETIFKNAKICIGFWNPLNNVLFCLCRSVMTSSGADYRKLTTDDAGYEEDNESLSLDEDDELLMTASDPELCCSRFVEIPKLDVSQDDMLSNRGRFKSHLPPLRIHKLTDSCDDIQAETGKLPRTSSEAAPLSPFRHHRLHRRSSLNKVRLY